MLRRRAGRALAVALVVAGLGLASCGVSTQGDATRIEPDDVPFGLLDDQATTTAVEAGRTATVYLRTEDRLVAVDRSVPKDAELADLLEQVISGPTEVEESLGITSAVPAGTIASVDTGGGIAEVDLARVTERALARVRRRARDACVQPPDGVLGRLIRRDEQQTAISCKADTRDASPAIDVCRFSDC